MSIIKRMRKQTATYWAKGEPDHYGKPSFAEPVEVLCRWDECIEEYRNEKGEKEFSSSTVYPDQVMSIGDKLKLGEIDSDTPDDPTDLVDAFEIKSFNQIPNLRNTEVLYVAYLGEARRW